MQLAAYPRICNLSRGFRIWMIEKNNSLSFKKEEEEEEEKKKKKRMDLFYKKSI